MKNIETSGNNTGEAAGGNENGAADFQYRGEVGCLGAEPRRRIVFGAFSGAEFYGLAR